MKVSILVTAAAASLSLLSGGCALGGGTNPSVANDLRNETMSAKSGPPVSPEQAKKANSQGAGITAPAKQ